MTLSRTLHLMNDLRTRTHDSLCHSAIYLSWHVRDNCLVRAYTRYKSPFALFRRALGDGPMRTLTKMRKCLEVHWRKSLLLNSRIVLSNCENS
jgi:hypothetical protein